MSLESFLRIAAVAIPVLLVGRFAVLQVLAWRVHTRWLSLQARNVGLERRRFESNASLRRRIELHISMPPGFRTYVAAERIPKGAAVVFDAVGQVRRAR